jgi:outer membrane protein
MERVGLLHGCDVLIFLMKERSGLMKKVFLLFVCVGLLLSSPLVYAAESIKIGVVDVQRIMKDSKRGTKEHEALMKRANELKQKVTKLEEELQALKDSLEKKGPMLSEQARRDKEKEYQQKARDYDWLVKDSQKEIQAMEQEVLSRLLKSLDTVVKKLGQEENYTIILEAGVVAYAAEGIDITDQVIKVFDAAKE